MCGILGFVGISNPTTQALVERESYAMRHRGPDGDGFWTEDSTTLAHRRLKIIDLTERSSQPIASEDGRYILTFNGEIYNYQQLASPSLAGDSLTLVHGSPVANDPSSLRGMFAYALWDRTNRKLLLARDRFGIKPLYYSAHGSHLGFGSTAASVAALNGAPVLSRHAIASYLRFGSVQGPMSIYRDVQELEPGTTLSWSEGQAHSSAYWEFPQPKERKSPDLRRVLLDSVAAHGVSDVPIALFLSGGVDSAILGALAVEAGLDLTAFTLGFPGADIDEIEEAAITAAALGLRHEIVDHAERQPDFDAYFTSIDQPSIDGLNTYLVSEAAARTGFRVALTGVGADELFGGYSTFRHIPLVWALNLLPSSALRRELLSRKGNAAKSAQLIDAGCNIGRLHEEFRSVFTNEEVRRLTGETWTSEDIPAAIHTLMDSISRLEIERYLRNTLLRDADVFSMSQSLELRTPFVDHLVLDSALSFSNVRRAHRRKGLLAAAVGNRRVSELLRMPKRGFRLPIDAWLRGTLTDRVEDLGRGPLSQIADCDEIVSHVSTWRSGRAHHSKVWSLVVLDAWLRRQGAVTVGSNEAG
jgi:asparagine synthase (glutamine-hydrolysing)